MQKLSFINSIGETIEFNSQAPYIFWKISGIETPASEAIYTQAPNQNGFSIHSILLTSRIVKITGHVHGFAVNGNINKSMYEKRRQIAHICSPMFGAGNLIYENDAGKWQIPAYCKSSAYGEKAHGIQTIELIFECPSPFWLSKEQSVVQLAYMEGGMQFPLSFPSYFGTLGYRATITNNGDTKLPVEITIMGGAKNPVIKNISTGQKIQLQKQLLVGDKLYLNTDPSQIAVQLISVNTVTNVYESENAFGYLTDDSELFQLVPGENEISFTSDMEGAKLSVDIKFYERFAGL